MLPDQATYEEAMYRAQRYIVVRGHAQEAGLPPEGQEAYEFNIKIDFSESQFDLTDPLVKKAVDEFLTSSIAEAKEIWSWITDVKVVGRSGGWAVILMDPPGFREWVAAYNDEASKGSSDERQLIWMSIQRRLEDLDEMTAFIADQQRTLKQALPDLIRGGAS